VAEYAKYLAPIADVVFKKIFGDHPHLLKSFLNSLLPLEEGREIVELTYLPPELIPDIPDFKRTIADVLCTDQDGRKFIVEMQTTWEDKFKPRLVFETSKVVSRQLKIGQDYSLLQPVYGLGLIGQSFDGDQDKWYHHYKLTDTQKSPYQSLDYFHLIFVEIPKVPLATRDIKKLGILWLRFMREVNEETKYVSPDLLAVPEIAEAVKLTEAIAYSPGELRYYESYWGEISVLNTLINGSAARGKAEGKAEGLAEGERKAKEKIALSMLAKSIPLSEIIELTGLDQKELENLESLKNIEVL